MKFLLIGLAIIAVIFLVMIITFRIFGGAAASAVVSPPLSANTPASSTAGANRNQSASSSVINTPAPQGFRGPSGPPHVIGPSGEPPNY